MFKGYLDDVDRAGRISGWAASGTVAAPVVVKVNGRPVGSTGIGTVRPDLASAGLPVNAGFSLTVPGIQNGDVVEVLFPDGSHLANSPWIVRVGVQTALTTEPGTATQESPSVAHQASNGGVPEVHAGGGDVRPRCWGIGLGRTGTTTLCTALRVLGYANVIHNPTFEQIRTADGGSDNGVTIYYKYIDYKFPGSKFVLTVRDLDLWLPSIKYITDKFPVQSREEDDPIKRRMLLYGSVAFDRDLYIRAYFRHLDDVRLYFRNRPHDLLEMDITRGDGWEKLCPFLGLPIPKEQFPHLNQRK